MRYKVYKVSYFIYFVKVYKVYKNLYSNENLVISTFTPSGWWSNLSLTQSVATLYNETTIKRLLRGAFFYKKASILTGNPSTDKLISNSSIAAIREDHPFFNYDLLSEVGIIPENVVDAYKQYLKQ